MPRYSWKGALRLSLVTVPVQAINTQESGAAGKVALHQLHDRDHSRIRHVKVCPVHGEVSNSEIVSGYEVAKDEYVVIEPDELDALRAPREKGINLDAFVGPDAIDSLYFAGRNYFLIPDGEAAAKPYSVLLRAMQKQKKWAVGQAVMFGREQLVLVRPEQDVLLLAVLLYDAEVRKPEVLEVQHAAVSAGELRLAETLIKASTPKRFDVAQYQDEYTHKLRTLIDAKVAGREIVTPPGEEEPVVVNLMDALRASVAKSQKRGAPTKRAKPPKKLAASHRSPAAKRRKSS